MLAVGLRLTLDVFEFLYRVIRVGRLIRLRLTLDVFESPAIARCYDAEK